MDVIDRSDPAEKVDISLDKIFDRLSAAEAPVWEGQNEMARTLITLSAGALVLTVSLVQLLADQFTDPRWVALLLVSWLLFGVSVITGVLRHGWASEVRSYRLQFEISRGDLRTRIRKLPDTEDWGNQVNILIDSELERISLKTEKATKVHDILIKSSGWTFILGLVSLLGFTMKNLPF